MTGLRVSTLLPEAPVGSGEGGPNDAPSREAGTQVRGDRGCGRAGCGRVHLVSRPGALALRVVPVGADGRRGLRGVHLRKHRMQQVRALLQSAGLRLPVRRRRVPADRLLIGSGEGGPSATSTRPSVMPLPPHRHRDEFPALQTGIHLLSHSLGPMPRATRQSLNTYLDLWERQILHDVWPEHWWGLCREIGDRIARLLGRRPGTAQIQPNASVALGVVASCFDFGEGQRRRIITSALDFPTTGYVWEAQRRLGAEVVIIPSEDGITTPLEPILDSIDENTLLVALSHVSYRRSHRLDPRPIVERARGVGAMVLLDVYQSAGVLELDADGWGVDFMIGGTIKWLCGGPACGYLYVRPDLLSRLEPRLTGWVAHAEPFAFG